MKRRLLTFVVLCLLTLAHPEMLLPGAVRRHSPSHQVHRLVMWLTEFAKEGETWSPTK